MTQRIPAHEDRAVLSDSVSYFLLCAVRMCLELHDMWLDLRLSKKDIQFFTVEVRDTEALCFAFIICLLELSVACHIVSCRLMNEKKIDIVHVQSLESIIHRIFILIDRCPEFCRDEEFLSCYQTFADRSVYGLADGLLIHICVRRIDEPISHLYS